MLVVTARDLLCRSIPLGVMEVERSRVDKGSFHMQRQVPDTRAHSLMRIKPLMIAQTSGGRPPAKEHSVQALAFVSSLTAKPATESHASHQSIA